MAGVRRLVPPVDLLADLVLATIVGVAMAAVQGGAANSQGHSLPVTAVAALLGLLQGGALLCRRSHAATVLAVTCLAALATHPLSRVVPPVGALVALASYATTRPPRRSVPAAVAVAVVALAGGALVPRERLLYAGFLLALVALAWAMGESGRGRGDRLALAEERAERAERERAAGARRAAAHERARIARELHDVIAHNVSVMVVQASAGADVFDQRPDQAREALRAIAATGRAAMTELRRLLAEDDADGDDTRHALGPQPGLAELDRLVARVTAAGLPVAVAVDGRPRPLPAGVELSAYRIVQEGLTNALRHAHARRADVRLCWAEDGNVLDVVVTDDGVGGLPDGHGRGLVGMRERAALVGGTFAAGPRPGRGFEVRARLPLEAVR
jgi:signal transduction histidine kinase